MAFSTPSRPPFFPEIRVRELRSADRVSISSYPSWLKSSSAICVNGPEVTGTSSITRVAGVNVNAIISPELNGARISKNPSESQSVSLIECVSIPLIPSIFFRTRGPESKTPPIL